MSERKKLEQSWELRAIQGKKLTPADMIIELGKMVENCKHTDAHWIQEITQDGIFKDKLVKRCYLCGFNIDELDADPEFLSYILAFWDSACEEKKQALNESTVDEIKRYRSEYAEQGNEDVKEPIKEGQ
jgi:hypothetical protein